MSMLKKRRISSAQRTLLLAAATVILAVPCIAAAPYTLHLRLAPADDRAGANVVENKAAGEMSGLASQEPRVSQPGADFQAGPSDTDRARGEDGQVERAKIKSEMAANREVGFAYAGEPGQGSPQENAARIKRKMMAEEFEQKVKAMTPEERARYEREMPREEREARMKFSYEEMAERTKHLAELSRAAKITMQQAIDAALRQQQGTVMESSLMGERRFLTRQADGNLAETSTGSPSPVYRVVILSGDENAPVRTIVLVSAIDGTILRTAVE